MASSVSGISNLSVAPPNGVALTTIYAVPVSPSTPSTPSATATTDPNALPTNIIAASGAPSLPSYSYRITPATSSPTPSASQLGSNLSVGAKIGIGAGCCVLFLPFILGLFLLFRRRKSKILSQRKKPEYELGFSSPAPTHTTWGKSRLESRVDSRADTLLNHSIASKLDSSRSNSGMGSHIDTRSNSRLDQLSNRNDSRQSNRSQPHRVPSRNSLYNVQVPPSAYLAELATPTTPSDNKYYTYPIQELASAKEAGELGLGGHDAASEHSDLDTDPIVYEIVELPDTSRKSVRNWSRRTNSTKTLKHSGKSTVRDMSVTPKIPVPPVPEDDANNTSWLASEPTTPTKARFAL